MSQYNITVVGTSYVGLVTAVALAECGHIVTCLDVDENKIQRLKSGDPVIYEEGLKDLMVKNKDRLIYTDDVKSAYKGADVTFICVGTPSREDGSANLDYVFKAAEDVINNIDRDVIMVVKSTVPIGTNDKLQKHIDESNCDFDIEVVSNPEFLSQGTAVKNMLNADRIVIGTESDNAKRIMAEIYEPMGRPIVFTNRCSSEMIKYASNDFLALKISYINEIANLCELLGADVKDVAAGMGMDPRIGNKFLNAGIGYGGSCFPKDTKALYSLAADHGYDLKLVKATMEVNELQKMRLLEKSRQYYDSLEGLNVAVLGLTFKPGTDDLRDAPSIVNIPEMLKEGANIKVWDPIGVGNFLKNLDMIDECDTDMITVCDTPIGTLDNADICFIFTEWDEIKRMEPEDFAGMNNMIVLDGRNCFDVKKMRSANIIYSSIGR